MHRGTGTRAPGAGLRPLRPRGRGRLTLALLGACSLLLAAPLVASGAASTGEPLFHPCTACHPLTPGEGDAATRRLPNAFPGHRIELVGHDALGSGGKACLVCHDSPEKDPGKLKLADGSLVAITGDVSGVCYRCHADKHADWKAGVHGKRQPKCTSAGCHDPHAPVSVYAPPVTPFIGTGFQVQVLPERVPFTPLPPPAGAPPVETPAWLLTTVLVGGVTAAGLAGSLAVERQRR